MAMIQIQYAVLSIKTVSISRITESSVPKSWVTIAKSTIQSVWIAESAQSPISQSSQSSDAAAEGITPAADQDDQEYEQQECLHSGHLILLQTK
jgi:hypothetical protein